LDRDRLAGDHGRGGPQRLFGRGVIAEPRRLINAVGAG